MVCLLRNSFSVKCQKNFYLHVRARKDVVILAVVRGKSKCVRNTASVKTAKMCDNRIALRLWKFLKPYIFMLRKRCSTRVSNSEKCQTLKVYDSLWQFMTIFTFIATERYPGKNSRSVKLPAPSLVKIIEIYRKKSHFLYSICKVTEKLTTLQLFLKNFNDSFRNSYLLIRYMCSYTWCVFRFDTICFNKKTSISPVEECYFHLSCERTQIAKRIAYLCI